MVKPIVKKGVEFLTDTLGNKIGALPDPDVSTQKGRLQYYLKNMNIGDNEAIRLNKLPAYGEDDLSKYVPERRGKFALMPENWESTYYSLTNKDLSKVKNYKPEVSPVIASKNCGLSILIVASFLNSFALGKAPLLLASSDNKISGILI